MDNYRPPLASETQETREGELGEELIGSVNGNDIYLYNDEYVVSDGEYTWKNGEMVLYVEREVTEEEYRALAKVLFNELLEKTDADKAVEMIEEFKQAIEEL